MHGEFKYVSPLRTDSRQKNNMCIQMKTKVYILKLFLYIFKKSNSYFKKVSLCCLKKLLHLSKNLANALRQK